MGCHDVGVWGRQGVGRGRVARFALGLAHTALEHDAEVVAEFGDLDDAVAVLVAQAEELADLLFLGQRQPELCAHALDHRECLALVEHAIVIHVLPPELRVTHLAALLGVGKQPPRPN